MNLTGRQVRRKLIVVTILSTFLVSTLWTTSALAISTQYYDNGDTAVKNTAQQAGGGNSPSGANIAGVVGKTPYVRQASLYLKVYFNSASGGRINIQDYAYCPANTQYDDSGSSGSTGTDITRYKVYGDRNGVLTTYGKKNQDCRQTHTFNVNFNPDDRNGSSGYYEAILDVDHMLGSGDVQNMFRVTTDGVAISHASKPNGNGSEVTVEQVDASPANIDYKVPFGADCSVTSKKKVHIALFDLDNNGGSGAQMNGKVTIRLKVGNGTKPFKVITQNPGAPVPDPAMVGLVDSAQPTGDGRSTYVFFWANPEEKYQLLLQNVYNNNTIQYNLPFDGIYFQRDCQKWEVEPSSYIKKNSQSSWKTRDISVKAGDTVHFKQVAENIGAATAKTDGVVMKKYSTQTIPSSQLEGTLWDPSLPPQALQEESGWINDRTINIDNLEPGKSKINEYVPASITVPKNVRYYVREQEAYTVMVTQTQPDPDTGEPVEVQVEEIRYRDVRVEKYWNPPDGTRYCVRYKIDPSKKNGKDGRFGTATSEICAVVGASPTDFELTPQKPTISPRVYSYYPNINVTGRIIATPDASSVSGSHPWEIYAVRYRSRPDTMITKGETPASANPCRLVPAGYVAGSCELFSSNTLPPAYTATTNYQNGGPDELGSALCFFVRVQSPDESMDGRWRYSDMDCAISGASPRVQVWGGSAKVVGDIETVVKSINGKQIGSWGEYGVFSNGANYNMASGAGLRDAPTSRSIQDWNAMTFANNSSTYGRFAGDLALPTISTEGARVVSGDLTIDDIDDVIDLDANDAVIGNETRSIVNITGTLRIAGDLRYRYPTGRTGDSIRDIPRVILIANDIVVESDVTEVDPWIVSRNRISTCGDDLETPELDGVSGYQPLSALRLLNNAKCDTQLKFNGPVIAPKIYLYRTYDSSDGGAAEIFNLRASNFLSSFVGTGIDDPIASTDSIQETSPRF